MKNKKIITILIIIILIIITAFTIYYLYKNSNKDLNLQNNLANKSNQEIEEYILNIASYEANIEVLIDGNKNKTQYKMKQSYVNPNFEKQIIEEPSNISGLQTIYDGNTLTISNTKLNLSTVYQNYPYLADNFLWLNCFIQDYKNAKNTNQNVKLYDENNMVVMEIKLANSNQYISIKKLFIEKETGKIAKMIIQDSNQKNTICIIYKDIKINSLRKDDIFAFKINNILIGQY